MLAKFDITQNLINDIILIVFFSRGSDSPRELSNRRSGDPAVGAIVSMFRASPLRQDFGSKLGNYIEDSNPKRQNQGSHSSSHFSKISASSGLNSSKTTDDALEELRAYKEMKFLLLKKGSNK